MARNARRDQRERIHRLGAIREQYFRFYFELRHERAEGEFGELVRKSRLRRQRATTTATTRRFRRKLLPRSRIGRQRRALGGKYFSQETSRRKTRV